MVQECPPEMIRSPLETVILKAKLLDMGPPAGILALAIDPPNKSDINNSILVLKEVCALLQFDKGVFVKDDGEMTYIGRIMAVMPMSVRLTKLIVMGYLFSCLEDCIIISKQFYFYDIYVL